MLCHLTVKERAHFHNSINTYPNILILSLVYINDVKSEYFISPVVNSSPL